MWCEEEHGALTNCEFRGCVYGPYMGSGLVLSEFVFVGGEDGGEGCP